MKTQTLARLLRAGMIVAGIACIASSLADPPEDWCKPLSCSPYGDGSDGDLTVYPGDNIVITRDMNYQNLTIEPGAVLNTRGYTIRVCGTLWLRESGNLQGVITDLASGGEGGAGGECGSGADPCLHGPPAGCQERESNCNPGGPGEDGEEPETACAGRGGDGGGGGGGGGGAWWNILCIDADGGDGGGGGDGGSGGGCVTVYAFHYINDGTIHADGEDGEDGEDAPDPGYYNCGAEYYPWLGHDLAGGGGGGGGAGCGGDGGTVQITVAQHNLDLGTVHANGGAGGSGGDGGEGGGCLELGVARGGHDPGCPGGTGCGDGGHGGRGAHERGDYAEGGDGGENGESGDSGTCGGTLCCWPGDVDGDCDVDLDDLSDLLTAYGCCDGDPCYNPCADFDNNGCVDLSDHAALLSNYGCEPEPIGC